MTIVKSDYDLQPKVTMTFKSDYDFARVVHLNMKRLSNVLNMRYNLALFNLNRIYNAFDKRFIFKCTFYPQIVKSDYDYSKK